MMIDSIDFTTADEMFEFFSPWGSNPNLDDYIFRGHSHESYELVPTALRIGNVDWFWKVCGLGRPAGSQYDYTPWQVNAEYTLIRAFYRLADQRGLEVPSSEKMRFDLVQERDIFGLGARAFNELWIPNDLLETVALAQHYGIPTRLLDWTYDIFVALYFALTGAVGRDGKLEIWALNKEHISFCNNTKSKINLKFITPHYANNPNLNAQKGVFTHWPSPIPLIEDELECWKKGQFNIVDRRPLDKLISDTALNSGEITIFKRFTLPCLQAKRGCKILNKLGYDAAKIFPGYHGVAKQLLNQHKFIR